MTSASVIDRNDFPPIWGRAFNAWARLLPDMLANANGREAG